MSSLVGEARVRTAGGPSRWEPSACQELSARGGYGRGSPGAWLPVSALLLTSCVAWRIQPSFSEPRVSSEEGPAASPCRLLSERDGVTGAVGLALARPA